MKRIRDATRSRLPEGMMSKMNREELFEHMLSDPYHSKGRKLWLRELRDKGYWNSMSRGGRSLRSGTVQAKYMHNCDHSHPAHEHEE